MAVFLVLTAGGFVCGRHAAAVVHSRALPLVLIDPGHGGVDGGCGKSGGVLEKQINLAIGQCLAARLGRFGLGVAMTREDDRHLSSTHRLDLQARAERARELRVDALICLHADWSWDRKRKGVSVYYHRTSDKSLLLAGFVQDQLDSVTGVPGKPIPAVDLYVVRESRRPAILVEMGFLSNDEDRGRLVDPSYQEALADALTIGLMQYLLSTR